jgi:hypothetical protein
LNLQGNERQLEAILRMDMRMRPFLAPTAVGLALALASVGGAQAAVECKQGIEELKQELQLRERETDAGPVLEQGVAIEEEGGTTVYADTGPAVPRENWFGDSPDKASAVVELEEAIAARDDGDMESCRQAVTEARDFLAET